MNRRCMSLISLARLPTYCKKERKFRGGIKTWKQELDATPFAEMQARKTKITASQRSRLHKTSIAMQIAALKFLFLAACALSLAQVEGAYPPVGCTPIHDACNHFNADNSFKLYINGVLRGTSENWYDVYTIVDALRVNDVVSVLATDYGVAYGFGAIIRGNSFNHDTSNPAVWRGIKATPALLASAWYSASGMDCSWPNVIPGTTAAVYGKSKWLSDPAISNIWASGAGAYDTVLLRTVIGRSTAC
jgi:hypothetical protein